VICLLGKKAGFTSQCVSSWRSPKILTRQKSISSSCR